MPASIIVLIAMATTVAILAAYRKLVARDEDDFLHISEISGQVIANQRKVDRALTQVDRLGIGLTVATALYGLALFAFYLFTELTQRGQM